MDHHSASSGDKTLHTPYSSTAPAASPSASMWSRGHSSRSSASSNSTSSSPLPPRDSFDLYGSTTRLEDVTEEPQEREEGGHIDEYKYYDLNDYDATDSGPFLGSSPPASPIHAEYSLGEQDAWSTTSSGRHHSKRHRSVDYARHNVTDRFSHRFGSLSRRWKNRSAIGPQLSIVTHTALITRPSASSTESSQIFSPALSAISKHESHLSPSPNRSTVDASMRESAVVPIFIDSRTPRAEEDPDPGLATTPLLPPIMTESNMKKDRPIQSPLQSPSVATTPCFTSTRASIDTVPYSTLPSPPLSTRPSMASMQRSRANTTTNSPLHEIPPLHLLDERLDHWAVRLGHADFSIHPEPYMPDTIDLETYKEFRANWEQARKQYAQHLARTIEHYGETSKIFKLTQEKWTSVDDIWKRHDFSLSRVLSLVLTRLSDSDANAPNSPASSVLEKPITRIVIPPLDKSGKFPEMGDADIVGPLAVGPAKVAELQRGQPTPPQSPRKRNLFKFFSDILSRHAN